jgi:hypothetical protein
MASDGVFYCGSKKSLEQMCWAGVKLWRASHLAIPPMTRSTYNADTQRGSNSVASKGKFCHYFSASKIKLDVLARIVFADSNGKSDHATFGGATVSLDDGLTLVVVMSLIIWIRIWDCLGRRR